VSYTVQCSLFSSWFEVLAVVPLLTTMVGEGIAPNANIFWWSVGVRGSCSTCCQALALSKGRVLAVVLRLCWQVLHRELLQMDGSVTQHISSRACMTISLVAAALRVSPEDILRLILLFAGFCCWPASAQTRQSLPLSSTRS
jgi:hypothetical protein